MKKIIVFLFISFVSFIKGDEISKNKMRELIEQIKIQSKEKILVPQNGTNIFFNGDKLDKIFIKNVEGVSQESLFYGVGGINEETPEDEKNYLLKNLIEIEKEGKVVLSVNYANAKNLRNKILKDTRKYNFIGEAVPSYSANSIFQPLQKNSLKNCNKILT